MRVATHRGHQLRAGDGVTTIAWDGKTLAADSRITSGGLPSYVTKAWRLPDGRLLGCAGSMASAHAVYRWLAEGGDKPSAPKDFTAMRITNRIDGPHIEIADEGMDFYRIHAAKWAIGSGRDFAIAVMALGRSAREAVEIAAQFDIYTGLPLIELPLVC